MASCGSGGGPGGNGPSISALTFSVVGTATVGQSVNVRGQLSFEDADRDVASGAVEIRPPGGATPINQSFGVAGAKDQLRGATEFVFGFVPPSSGAHAFDIWLVDAQGNPSNRLSGSVNVP